MFNPFFVEDKEVLVQRRQLQLDPLVAVSTANPRKSVLFGTTLRNGGGELVWEYDLIPISVGGLNPQMDYTTKKIEVAPNSNSSKGDYPIPADSAHISSNSTLNLKDNLENSHASKSCDKAETYVTEKTEIASSNKAPHISYTDLEKVARNFETPFDKLSDICEDIKMESSSDTGAEISKLKTTSLHSWKRIIRDKQNLNVKDSSTSMPVHAKRLVGEADTITDLDIGHKQKK